MYKICMKAPNALESQHPLLSLQSSSGVLLSQGLLYHLLGLALAIDLAFANEPAFSSPPTSSRTASASVVLATPDQSPLTQLTLVANNMDIISLSPFVTSCVQEATPNLPVHIASISRWKEERSSIVSTTIPSPLSEGETLLFHAGLPSGPPLIARTGVPWKEPGDPKFYPWIYTYKRKLQVVGEHPIAVPGLWPGRVGPKILDVLDEFKDDDSRTIYDDSRAPVVRIAVEPGTLSGNEGDTVARRCQEVLDSFCLNDVEVCIRGSKYHREAAPEFEEPGLLFDPTAELRMPFTSAVGFPISTNVCPTAEGSLGLFFVNGSDTSTVYFLTARHVAIPLTTRDDNKLYEAKNKTLPRHDVTVFSEKGINDHLKAIRIHIGNVGMPVEHHQDWINELEGREDEAAVAERENGQAKIRSMHEALEELEKLYEDRCKFRHAAQGRAIGSVTLSPPITFSVGDNQYTEDWAIGQVYANKINVDTFCPNVLDLGYEPTFDKLVSLMNPNAKKPRSFEYPNECLLEIRGIVSDAEIRNPSDKDENGDPCMTVLKRGKKTGLTVGRVNNVDSFVRTYWNDGTVDTSMELPVFGCGSETGPFSEPGDSGSIVVDGKGRAIGMIIGGVGYTTSSDVTYVTPAEFLFDQIRSHGIDPNINFSLKAAT